MAQETSGASSAAADSEPTSAHAISARTQAVARELVEIEAVLANPNSAPQRSHLEEVRDQLSVVETLLRRQAEARVAVDAPRKSPSRPTQDALPSVFELNLLYETQFGATQRARSLSEALTASRAALEAAKEQLQEAETKRREARGEFEAADGTEARLDAERTLELWKLTSRLAQERVHLRTLETRIAQQRHADAAAEPGIEERIEKMRAALAAGKGELSIGFARLARREAQLQRDREEAERLLSARQLRLEAVRRSFSRQTDPSDALFEEMEALSVSVDSARQSLALIEAGLERVRLQRPLWRQWDSLLRGGGTRQEHESLKEVMGERIEALEHSSVQRRAAADDLAGRLQSLHERIAALPAGARLRTVLDEQRESLERLLQFERLDATELGRDRRFSQQILADLRDRTGEIDPLQYAARSAEAVGDVWSYEITAVDDSPITVGSLVLALALAAIGLWAARRGSGFAGRVATQRLRLDAGAAHALETLSFYVLLVSFTLLALRVVHFPLTAFTVVGGALAIGIGFGSQNVMNNFISGLILMLERPVRAGDVVEVDGNHGAIESIGARSTQIRSVDGRHIIVPNSFFLESNVVNWTLSDDLLRTGITVGVIYGSPTRLVEELIRRVVDEEEHILKHPEPIVVFQEFGDNSLNFDVHFWVRARSPMDMRKVQSRVRFRIDDLFREHGLVIAFPQRDVHLDSSSPIEVRVLNGGNKADDTRRRDD